MKIRSNEIIIKPADNGSIVVVMMPKYYWTMCQSHLNNEQYYAYLKAVFEKIINYTDKYHIILTINDYEYLINHNYKISDFYMNLKFHKFKELKEVIKGQNPECISITKNYKLKVDQLFLDQFITQAVFLKYYI